MRAMLAMAARVISGVLLCTALAVLGGLAVRSLDLPFPGAVLGMLAYLALLAGGRWMDWSRPGAALLLRWIGAFIVPALVGLTAYAALLAGAALPLMLVLVATTLLTAAATAAIFRLAGGRG